MTPVCLPARTFPAAARRSSLHRQQLLLGSYVHILRRRGCPAHALSMYVSNSMSDTNSTACDPAAAPLFDELPCCSAAACTRKTGASARSAPTCMRPRRTEHTAKHKMKVRFARHVLVCPNSAIAPARRTAPSAQRYPRAAHAHRLTGDACLSASGLGMRSIPKPRL